VVFRAGFFVADFFVVLGFPVCLDVFLAFDLTLFFFDRMGGSLSPGMHSHGPGLSVVSSQIESNLIFILAAFQQKTKRSLYMARLESRHLSKPPDLLAGI